jgi:hypothetical protein
LRAKQAELLANGYGKGTERCPPCRARISALDQDSSSELTRGKSCVTRLFFGRAILPALVYTPLHGIVQKLNHQRLLIHLRTMTKR